MSSIFLFFQAAAVQNSSPQPPSSTTHPPSSSHPLSSHSSSRSPSSSRPPSSQAQKTGEILRVGDYLYMLTIADIEKEKDAFQAGVGLHKFVQFFLQ